MMLLTFVLFWLAQAVTLDANAILTPHVTSGHFTLLEPATGTRRSLLRQDLAHLGKNVSHLSLTLNDETISPMEFRLGHRSVWSKDSVMEVHSGPQLTTRVAHNIDGDCFLHGKAVTWDGTAVLVIKRCAEKWTGSLNFATHLYDLEEDGILQDDGAMTFKFTRRDHGEDVDTELSKNVFDVIEEAETKAQQQQRENDNIGDKHNREKRESYSIKIEIALVLDSSYANYLYFEMGMDTHHKMLDFMVSKWATIQGVYADPDEIGAEVEISVKRIDVWWENVENYPDESMGVLRRLQWFCRNTPETDHYDIKVLYTKNVAGRMMGMTYVHGLCDDNRKCSLVRSHTPSVFIELHEMGHGLGFVHDPQMGDCKGSGFMGWGPTYDYLPCYKDALVEYLGDENRLRCLFQDNVRTKPNLLDTLGARTTVGDASLELEITTASTSTSTERNGPDVPIPVEPKEPRDKAEFIV